MPCKGRNHDIDVIKGMLVFLMVVYHSASMGRETYPQLQAITISMDFLHYAFILTAGFVCGWHYSPRLGVSREAVSKRLRVRAGKIMALVIALNASLYAAGFTHGGESLAQAVDSFSAFLQNFVLSVNGELVAAEILVYIAVFLFVASFLVNRVSVPVLLFTLLTIGTAGYFSGTAVFVAVGLLGMVVGVLADRGALTGVWERMRQHKWLWPALLAVYVYEIPFVRWIAHESPPLRVLLCTVESCLWFLTFLVFMEIVSGHIHAGITKLGEYTLFAYLAQMFIVRMGYTAMAGAGMSGPLYFAANVLSTSVILCLLVAALNGMRRRSWAVNGVYQVAFQ